MKQISIIIPTYKRTTLLSRCLSSVSHHNTDQVEVIVVDDDPDMSGAKIVSDFHQVKYFAKRGYDRGLSKSRNIGIDLSKGKYLLFLDDDDYLNAGSLHTFLQRIESGKNFYYGDFSYFKNSIFTLTNQSEVTHQKQLIVNSIPMGSFIMEKASIQCRFDESMRSHEDWDFLLKNIDWNTSEYIEKDLVIIDKNEYGDPSMQTRRRNLFWIDFLIVYNRNPAPELAEIRKVIMNRFGVSVPEELFYSENPY
jgi:glycosyltransferase involved in cell wall biosynthesis